MILGIVYTNPQLNKPSPGFLHVPFELYLTTVKLRYLKTTTWYEEKWSL